MALPVNVSSVDVLVSAREAIVLFTEDAQSALAATDSEIRRCVDWLTHDQKLHWQGEVKRRQDDLSGAKAELHRKQLSQVKGGNVHDSEQREAVRLAKRRLEEAEEKVELVKRTLPILEKAVMEYLGQARPFADALEFEVERSGGLLDRMIVAIEEYSRTTAPTTRSPERTPPSPAPVKANVAAPEQASSAPAIDETTETP